MAPQNVVVSLLLCWTESDWADSELELTRIESSWFGLSNVGLDSVGSGRAQVRWVGFGWI